MPNVRFASLSGAVLALLLLSSCATQGALGPMTGAQSASRSTHDAKLRPKSVTGGVIQHVVYIIQEHRRFNYMFMVF